MARLVSLVPRLTAPLIVRGDGLPSFGNTVQWPREGRADRGNEASGGGESGLQDGDGEMQQYSTLIIPPAADGSSGNNSTGEARSTSLLQSLCEKAAKRRVIFFGEQHQQPKVLSAQLQVLYHVIREAQKRGAQVHVVFEQFSLNDQSELAGVVPWGQGYDASGVKTKDQRSSSESAMTSEGFHRDHYMMLVNLVREMNGSVWGGFPPRDWARILARSAKIEPREEEEHLEHVSALQQVQQLDSQRYKKTLVSVGGDAAKVIPTLPIPHYKFITNVGWGHRAYLKGMFHPETRPPVPEGVHSIPSPPEEKAGFIPAQALKDTFFAHTISSLLQRDRDCIVIAICGAGHCEWSFGAPERVQQMIEEAQSEGETKSLPVRPFVFLSKPDDSGFWPEDVSNTSDYSEQVVRDAKSPPRVASAADEQWQRKQADAILLYEWID